MWQIYLNYHQRMEILSLKKCVYKLLEMQFATKQRMFGVIAIDEILSLPMSLLAGSRTLCHPEVGCILANLKRNRKIRIRNIK